MNIKSYNKKDQTQLELFFKEMFQYLNFSWLPESKNNDIRNINTVYNTV